MRKQVVEILDDINGQPASETVSFTFDGIKYDTDLSAENAEKFRSQMKIWIENAARKKRITGAGRQPKGRMLKSVPAVSAQEDGARKVGRIAANTPAKKTTAAPRKIRSWAKSVNMDVAAKGRIPAPVRSAFFAAHKQK